jgi:hypothetical protein
MGVLVQSGVQPVSCRISAWSRNVDASNAVRSEMERINAVRRWMKQSRGGVRVSERRGVNEYECENEPLLSERRAAQDNKG